MKNSLALTLVNCFYYDTYESGNPAAVVLDHQGDTTEKLVIAAELNLPVTVFVSDALSETPLIEYFYPNKKMPLCLHGTLAAAAVLLGMRRNSAIQLKTAENKILKIIKTDPDYLQVEVSSQQVPSSEITADIVTQMLNIEKSDIAPNLPLIVASVGSAKLLIPITSSSTLDKIKPNFLFIEEWSLEKNINGIYVYAEDPDSSSFNARGFNPKTGHNEDAATGVAAAALSLTLERSIVVYQGASLNKQCMIKVSYQNPDSIWVGGKANIVKSE